MYDRRNYVGKYSAEEVEQLKSLKEKHGNDWATIGAAMGRSASSVKDRFRLMRDHCHSGFSTLQLLLTIIVGNILNLATGCVSLGKSKGWILNFVFLY